MLEAAKKEKNIQKAKKFDVQVQQEKWFCLDKNWIQLKTQNTKLKNGNNIKRVKEKKHTCSMWPWGK